MTLTGREMGFRFMTEERQRVWMGLVGFPLILVCTVHEKHNAL